MNRVLCDEKMFLRRTKSLCQFSGTFTTKATGTSKNVCTEKRSRTASESSVEAYVVHRTDSETSLEEHDVNSSSIGVGKLTHLEHKMDQLSDLFMEQCRILAAIKEEIQNSREVIEKSSEMYSHVLAQLTNNIEKDPSRQLEESDTSDEETANSRARTLLDAIQVKQTRPTNVAREMKDAFARFLQSDELAERVAVTTAAAVREAVRGCVQREVAAVYLPLLQRAHRRLHAHAIRALEDAFAELEEHTSRSSHRMYRASRQLRRALERHQRAASAPQQIQSLQRTAERILDNEMNQWRQKILECIPTEGSSESDGRSASPTLSVEYPAYGPVSPTQPADPEHSVIDQLMQAALINKQMEEGDVNGSFERALCAGDLTLVVAACRAAAPAAPSRLQQHVLLALLQQLATDMLHDTILKCRYLEEAIISLNTSNPTTRAHLPMVVGEVRKHLSTFLVSYPKHVASRRITLIVMAADNLLKYCT